MRTVLYARFSNDELQNRRSSADQLAMLRERAAKEGWTVVGVFQDDGISGAAGIDARPGLTAALDMIERREADQMLAESTDRIARHQGDAYAVRERLEYAGGRLFTLFDGVVDDITGTIKGLFDARFRKDLAQRIKRGQRGSVGEGRAPAGLAYGYRMANRFDDQGRAVRGLREIDRDQAAVVVQIFEWFAEGHNARTIAHRLNQQGVPGPRGNEWRGSTITGDRQRQNGMLQNRLYIGELVHNRTSKVTDPRTRRVRIRPNPESEWIREKVPQLRIVSDDLWDRVRARRAAQEGVPFRQQRRPKRLLSGLVECGTCGGSYVVVGPDRWGCSGRRDGSNCTNNRTIGNKQLEERVKRGLREKILDPELVAIYVREYHLERAADAAASQKRRAKLERQLADTTARIERLVEAIACGGEEFAEIRDVLAKARATRDALQAELGEIEALPVIALHPNVAQRYREEISWLTDDELTGDDDVAPRLRALIGRVIVSPAEKSRSVEIDLQGRLASILALATGREPPERLMFEVERVKGIGLKHIFGRARV